MADEKLTNPNKTGKIVIIVLVCFVAVVISCSLGFIGLGMISGDNVEATNDCLTEVQNKYQRSWNQTCNANGMTRGCNLPLDSANRLDTIKENEIDRCYGR